MCLALPDDVLKAATEIKPGLSKHWKSLLMYAEAFTQAQLPQSSVAMPFFQHRSHSPAHSLISLPTDNTDRSSTIERGSSRAEISPTSSKTRASKHCALFVVAKQPTLSLFSQFPCPFLFFWPPTTWPWPQAAA